MKAKASVLAILGGVGLSVIAPGTVHAASAKVNVKQLQAENRRLAEELRSAQTELHKMKTAAPATPKSAAASTPATDPVKDKRDLEPLPLSPSEIENAPGSSVPTSTTPAGDGKKDFMLAVGTKVWITEWNTWRAPNVRGADRGQNIQTLTSGSSSETSPIPSLTARYKSFFLTGSYLAETDYSFPTQSQVYDFVDNAGGHNVAKLAYKFSGQRREWDVSLGYQILPYLAVTAGYKEIRQKFGDLSCLASIVVPDTNRFANRDCLGTAPQAATVTYAGPTLGISGAAPIGKGFGLYGNFAYGWLAANYRADSRAGGDKGVTDVDYYVGELGLTYTHLMKSLPIHLPLTSATAYAGYRYQTYESTLRERNLANGNNPKDVVQGFVAGFNLAY
jgi:hypothetical protein